MNWTAELLDAVKGNDVAHGLLKTNAGAYYATGDGVPLWRLIEQAAKDGAGIQIYDSKGWSSLDLTPLFDVPWKAYRVAPSWQPPEERCEVERCEVERCEVEMKYGNISIEPVLFFTLRGRRAMVANAQNHSDFIAYEYADGHKRPHPRVMQGNDKPALAPVAVLFRRRT
jgi:hypothetical protein